MSRVVELTGPTGSGKSAIYAEMVPLGGFIANPSPQEAAGMVDAALRWGNAADFLSFLGWCFRTAEDHDGRLAKRESGTLRALAKLHQARTDPDPQWMVIDGGLIHRAQSIDRLQPKKPTSRYFELMPLPDAVVSVTCNPEVLAERNRLRGGSHDRREDLERQIRCHEMGMEILARRGVPILNVDTTDLAPDVAARQILGAMGLRRDYTGARAEGYEARRKDDPKWQAEQAIIEAWLDELPAGSCVLDAPCGTGRFFDCYARKGFTVRALDASADMIREAARKIANPTDFIETGSGPSARWRFIHGDVRAIDLPDKSVDCALAVRVTRWLSISDCAKMFREIQRVARKRVIWTARVHHETHPEHARPLELFQDALAPGWTISRNMEASEPGYRVMMAEAKPWFYTGSPHGDEIAALGLEALGGGAQ